jgi:protein-disulfide isomerase
LRRDNKLAPLLAIVGGAIVLIVAIVVASQISSGSKKSNSSTIATDSIAEMLSGIPQKGIALGNSKAKVTLIEFSDPQCPYCGQWARNTFPALVQNYVRSGKLRIEYRGVNVIDNPNTPELRDSNRMIRLAQAAGLQSKLWYVVEFEFENQGAEGSGYATDAFLKGIAGAVGSGFDAGKAISVSNTNAVVPMMDAAQKLAETKIGKRISTPTFFVELTGSTQSQKIVGAQPLSTFTQAIDALLKK